MTLLSTTLIFLCVLALIAGFKLEITRLIRNASQLKKDNKALADKAYQIDFENQILKANLEGQEDYIETLKSWLIEEKSRSISLQKLADYVR